MSDLVGRIELGPIAAGVFERSKFDNAIIVGSEIRAALGEQRKTIERLQAEVERLRADQTLFATGDRAILEQNQKLKAEVERLRLSQMSAFYEGWDARSRARTFEVDTAWEYSSTKELLDEHGNR